MKKVLLAAAFLAGSSVAALADVGAGLVGNTVTLTGPEGAVTQVYYPDASTTEVKLPDGSTATGTWRVDGNKICTVTGENPETCTAAIEEAPTVGSSGTIEGEQGNVEWQVSEGKAF
ncbi:hypothetical protein [Tepidicaulis sp.]|jgi:hypothetical protein|uniref:hypothetical protein n=1 Tax=Tepidicaulis sp. TaxID=1920809 RepID=UPI003B59BFD2